MKKNILYILFIVALMAACEASRPSYVLDDDEMEDVLYDIHRAHFSYSDYRDRENGARQYALFLNVLKKHDITQSEWDSSMVYYTRNAHELEHIYERLFERVNSEAAAMGAGVGEMTDTTDIWNTERQLLLFDYAPYTTNTWSVVTDSILSPGERITLRFSGIFLSDNANRYVTAILALRLNNDSVVVRNMMCSMSGPNTLVIADDKAVGIKSVYGMFMMHKPSSSVANISQDETKRQIFSIYDIRLLHEPVASRILTDTLRPLSGQPQSLSDAKQNLSLRPQGQLPVREQQHDTTLRKKMIQEPLNSNQHGTKTRFNGVPK
ncbi:MAG: DUF4296 domain-containing protein [Bacteroidales bacterium]|nr:DUF4296 domain-containing protein [Bacteroidales bacterium]MCM1147560.1 DUF4296 domain-containing protein [Bacteroidales bacterium]MCM1206350.1 DUF4296 domain-containing protein [Bacillota bacterium]MCM1511221.1 DUF4296 domain-containing protein [Clostridium sp.]